MQHIADHQPEHLRQVSTWQKILQVMPVQQRQIQIGDVDTGVLEGGDGPPLVFLQGEFTVVWMRIVPELVKTHRVILADLPGLGQSRLTGRLPDTDGVVDWLAHLIDATCPEPPVVVGKGMGGAVALRTAARHEEKLAGVVAVGGHGLAPYRPPLGMALSFLGLMLRPSKDRLERSFGRYCFIDLSQVKEQMDREWNLLRAYALEQFGTPSVRGAMRKLMPLSAPLAKEELQGLKVPVTLIWGRHDVGMPLRVAEAAHKRYGWPLQVIEDARDDPGMEQPEAFIKALRTAIRV